MLNAEANELKDRRDDAADLLESLEKVPESRRREVLGIVKGFALCAESEKEAV